MGYKENVGRYSPKGIMLNLTHLCVFFTPIILCTRGFEEWAWLWKVNLGIFCAMFATPPWGWKKRTTAWRCAVSSAGVDADVDIIPRRASRSDN